MTALYYLGGLLAVALIILAARAWVNHREIERLRANGYSKIGARKYNRGHVTSDAMRGFAELGVLILLLIAVFGWLSHGSPQ